MSAVFNNKQHTSGYQVGAGESTKALVTLLSLALIGYNAVHLHDYALIMFVSDQTWLIKEASIRLAAVGLAFLEIIIGGVFVYLYRTSQYILNPPLLVTGFLALVVAFMAVVAGNGSQQSKADVKTNQINAYESTLTANQSQIKAAESERDIALRLANQIKDANQRAIEKDRAHLNYENRIAALNKARSELQSHRPIQPIKNGSTWHYISITAFSVLCSFGALFLSGYSAAFLKPLVAIPAFSLMRKIAHPWQSDGSDFQTVQHKVSPIGGLLSGIVGTQKLTKEPLPSQGENNETNNQSSGTSKNHPHGVDLVSGRKIDTGERLPNEDGQKSANVEYSESHYEAIKHSILNETFKPTQAPVKKKLVSLKVRFVDDAARQQKAVEILDQLSEEGVIIDNPVFGVSGKMVAKYILNPDYQKSEDTQEEEIGEHDLVTVCPHCQTVNTTHVLKIEQRNGTVKCNNCEKGHMATSHQYTMEQHYTDMLANAKTS